MQEELQQTMAYALEEVFSFVLEQLPRRSVVAATDASGFSGRNRSWCEIDYGIKAKEKWVKAYAVIEVHEFFVLSYELTESNVHESQMFAEAWASYLRTYCRAEPGRLCFS